jgi:hypothetical protein
MLDPIAKPFEVLGLSVVFQMANRQLPYGSPGSLSSSSHGVPSAMIGAVKSMSSRSSGAGAKARVVCGAVISMAVLRVLGKMRRRGGWCKGAAFPQRECEGRTS